MKPAITTLATAIVLGFASISAQAQNLAIVNGKPVPSSRLEFMINRMAAGQPGGKLPAEQEKQVRAEIRDKLITQEVLAQEAQRRGIENSDAFKTEMEFARQAVLVNTMRADYMKKSKPTDAEVKAEYDRAVAQMAGGGKEYKSRHILVDSEKQAQDLIAQINKGAKFDALAKKFSKDPGSGKQGGDLGWVEPVSAGFVPEFTQALQGLKKGQMTATPVKSQFGYHIIKLEDVREPQKPKIPPMEEVRPQIEQKLMSDKLQAFEKSIRDKAVIK